MLRKVEIGTAEKNKKLMEKWCRRRKNGQPWKSLLCPEHQDEEQATEVIELKSTAMVMFRNKYRVGPRYSNPSKDLTESIQPPIMRKQPPIWVGSPRSQVNGFHQRLIVMSEMMEQEKKFENANKWMQKYEKKPEQPGDFCTEHQLAMPPLSECLRSRMSGRPNY